MTKYICRCASASSDWLCGDPKSVNTIINCFLKNKDMETVYWIIEDGSV